VPDVRPWYDLAVSTRGRTTVGISRLIAEEMGTFIGAFRDGRTPPDPRLDIPIAALILPHEESLQQLLRIYGLDIDYACVAGQLHHMRRPPRGITLGFAIPQGNQRDLLGPRY
jgi:hypothetical protein